MTLHKFDFRNPDYSAVFARRLDLIRRIREDRSGATLQAFHMHYETHPNGAIDFINDWVMTYDPRRKDVKSLPLILFAKQEELVRFFLALLEEQTDGLLEKSRDMGATWVACAFSVWLWRYKAGAAVGWGSRKQDLVDQLGIMDSIFEKLRFIIRNLPPEFLPAGFSLKDDMPFMRIMNGTGGATIAGEAGDNIGRGGRKLLYFKDESAHYERPERIEAALGDNTNCQIDFSSVNGPGNVFHRKREGGQEWRDGQPLVRDRSNVFVMDWRDHPLKDDKWYRETEAKRKSAGLLHLFRQETDRDYLASQAGVIIRPEWVNASIDAHIKLGWSDDGENYGAGMDVADEGPDKNGLVIRRGVVVRGAEEWADIDGGFAARHVFAELRKISSRKRPMALDYDCIGVGATVKAEINRLRSEGLEPPGLIFSGWNAGSGPLWKDKRLDPDDKHKEGPTHGAMFLNLKAQGWWHVARRFEKTFEMVNGTATYDFDELISLPSDLPNLSTLRKQLSQAVRKRSGALKQMVDKTPQGTISPNMADALIMCFFPVPPIRYNLKGWS